jgi:hypothetical protein
MATRNGFKYDHVNSRLALYANGTEIAHFNATTMTWNISPLTLTYPLVNTGAVTNNTTLLQTGVATFTAQDIHSGGLTVAATKPIVGGTLATPKLIKVPKTSGSGAWTLTAAELMSGLIIDATTSGGSAPTLPTVAAIVAVLPGYVAGTSFKLLFRNTGNQTATLTTDASAQWTMVGTMTITTTKQSEFLFVINSGTTGDVYCTSSNAGY